jgi:hypothetical protein
VEVRVRMGLHTGEPTVGEEGYLGLDVVRAARISAAGHGGQILLSETTRALVGNDLPPGAAVHDLGEQQLKDIQHEHVYELSIDGAPRSAKPLRTDRPKTAEETLAERIQAHVEQSIEEAFTGAFDPKQTTRFTLFGLANLLLVLGAVVLVVVLLKVVL